MGQSGERDQRTIRHGALDFLHKIHFDSLMEAPRKKVSFTTCLYDSPVQTPPSCDQTGTPGDFGFSHFHSYRMSGSASRMSCRT
jgi:hypothetical protein